MSENTQADVQTQTPDEVSAPVPPQLTITDLGVLAQSIDLASRRGAYPASEFKQIGEAFTKLTDFLKFVESQQPVKDAEDEGSAD